MNTIFTLKSYLFIFNGPAFFLPPVFLFSFFILCLDMSNTCLHYVDVSPYLHIYYDILLLFISCVCFVPVFDFQKVFLFGFPVFSIKISLIVFLPFYLMHYHKFSKSLCLLLFLPLLCASRRNKRDSEKRGNTTFLF